MDSESWQKCDECQENRRMIEFAGESLICEHCMKRYTKGADTLEIRVHEDIRTDDGIV